MERQSTEGRMVNDDDVAAIRQKRRSNAPKPFLDKLPLRCLIGLA